MSHPLDMLVRMDKAIAELARRNHGVFTRQMVLAAGANAAFIKRRIAGGVWFVLAPGVYALASSLPTWERAVTAARLEAGEAGLGSHGTAAALWHFPDFRRLRPEILVPMGSVTQCTLGELRRTRRLRPIDRRVVNQIPVTSPARTIIDLAPRLSDARLGDLIDRQARRNTPDIQAERFASLASQGRPGITRLRLLLAERVDEYAPTESELEALALRVFKRGGLPMPEMQYPIPWREPGAGRLDFAWVPDTVLVETDGRDWHTRVEDFKRDRARDRQAVLNKWSPLRYTYWELKHEPDMVCDEIRQLLDQNRAGMGLYSGSVPRMWAVTAP
jgi:hypothetical protein